MKIIYTPTIIKGAYKSFYNYIKRYDAELVPLDFLNIPDLLECLDGYENNNRIISTLSLFFLHSFIQSYSTENFERDYNILKNDLSYGVKWNILKEKIDIIDKLVDDVIHQNPDWLFIRSFEDLEFFQLYFAYQIKLKSSIKICFGKEKEFKPHLKYIFQKEEFSDYVFVGHGENFLDSFFNDNLSSTRYEEGLIYKHSFLDSFNSNVSDMEIIDSQYNFSFHTLCPYKCVFCTQNKGNNLSLNYDHLDEVIDKLVYVNHKYDIQSNFCVSSLPFYTNDEIQYFFGKIYKIFGSKIKFNIVHLTTKQYLDNAELLKKFEGSLFYIGVEHFSDKILTLMKKPTNREMNLKLVINSEYKNVGYGIIYNFFKEDMNDFNDLIRTLKLIGKGKFFKLNSFQYTIPNDTIKDEKLYDIELIEPTTFINYFGIDYPLHLKYKNHHDPKLELLKEKNKIALSKGFGIC